MPKVYAKAFTAAELTKFGAALRRGDVVRTVAKGDKQVVYTAASNAVIPRLKYFVRGYREVDLGKNDALQSAFADVLRQRRNDASSTTDSRDSDTSIRSTDSSSSGGARIDGSDAPSETDQGPAYDRLAPNFFTQPKVSARTLKAYVSAGVLNLSLRELSSELSDKKSALHTHLVIAACVENGTLSQKTAMLVRRAVLADMTREVLKLKKAGLLHNDVKCPNFCIDASGRLHLIDFGTASMGPSRLTSENSKAQNPRFIACEIETDVLKQVNIKTQETDARHAMLQQDRLKVPGGKGRQKRLLALKKKYDADISKIKAAPAEYAKYDQSAEMWSLGVAAFELFGLQSQYSSTAPDGDSTADDYYFPFDGTSHGQVASRLATFQTETPDQRKQILNLSRCDRKSPLGRRDDAIFAMLDPDPTTRITPEALLKSRFLADDDLNNPALRTLIAALGRGDRQAIRKATSRVE
ncbi:MAG: hypothetical protein JWR21_3370 [Herminiimonas sp.]|nr:hypothetical protein [Herminiimonas sp.]